MRWAFWLRSKDLTPEDAAYRRERIAHFTQAMADRSRAKVAELTWFLDLWMIVEVEGADGSVWVPYPGWDDRSPLTRDSYPTLATAKGAVRAAGADLRPQRGIR